MEIACVIDSRLAPPARPGPLGRPISDDPLEAGERTEATARRLEAIGAAVELRNVGEVFFAAGGLRGLHGGEVAGVIAAARQATGTEVLIGVAPTRTAARAAAERGEKVVTPARLDRFLAALPTAVLVDRLDDPRRTIELTASLEFRLPGRRWEQFRVLQTDSGQFAYRYTFEDDDSAGVRFLFRAFVPATGNWSFAPATSEPRAVTG